MSIAQNTAVEQRAVGEHSAARLASRLGLVSETGWMQHLVRSRALAEIYDALVVDMFEHLVHTVETG